MSIDNVRMNNIAPLKSHKLHSKTDEQSDVKYQGEKVDVNTLNYDPKALMGRSLVSQTPKPIKYNDPRPKSVLTYGELNLDTTLPSIKDFNKNVIYGGGYDILLPITPMDSSVDYSDQSIEMMKNLVYFIDTFKNTPSSHLPDGWDPQKVYELGMDPGLNVRKVHNMGITGKGVNIAILDSGLVRSKSYDDNIVSYSAESHAKSRVDMMHGASVASILAGKETGVAPDANVYYFAEMEDSSGKDNNDMQKSLEKILKINESLPDDEKIRVVSISGSPYGENKEEVNNLIKKLNDSGVWVMSATEFEQNFGYLSKKDPMGNPDDFDNYQVSMGARNGRQLYVNSGNRTVANFTGETDYRHDSKASASWAIPVVSGYYALACQADPSMTPERFLQLADETAQIKTTTEESRSIISQRSNDEKQYAIYKEQHPNATFEEYMQLEDKSYLTKELHNRQNNYATDELSAGANALLKEGKLDENYEVIDKPQQEIKIIDIEALIKRILDEKSNN